MNKGLIAIATALAVLAGGAAQAQVAKAVSEAADAVENKVEQKQAESAAKKSGPVGKVVNNVKAGYHKKKSAASAKKAKKAISG